MSLQADLLSFIKEGVTGRDVYQHALNFVKEKKPELEKHFVKNVGHGVRPSDATRELPLTFCFIDWFGVP